MKSTDQLMADHVVILKAVDVLCAMARNMEAGRTVDATDGNGLIEFFAEFADHCHHMKEEVILFPALAEAGMPAQSGPIGVMLYEHEKGREMIRGMRNALSANQPENFARYATGYAEMLRQHIDKENYILFDMAGNMLKPEEDARIFEAFQSFETEKVGAVRLQQYHQTVHDLAAKYLDSSSVTAS